MQAHVHAADEEEGTKSETKAHDGEQRQKMKVRRREGEEEEMWCACSGMVMRGMRRSCERESGKIAAVTVRNERKEKSVPSSTADQSNGLVLFWSHFAGFKPHLFL